MTDKRKQPPQVHITSKRIETLEREIAELRAEKKQSDIQHAEEVRKLKNQLEATLKYQAGLEQRFENCKEMLENIHK